jgi:poly(3-hydroxybutyrate) depolymerase
MKNKNKNILFFLTLSLTTIIACSAGTDEEKFNSSGCGSSVEIANGMLTITSDNVTREYYLKLPEAYDSKTAYPLVIGLHGTGGDYTKYTENEYYNLHGAVGEEAILVYPNALLNANDVAQWVYYSDLSFFDDLYEEIESNICFDTRKVFAAGHSSGGGFSHFLGCKRGNILRAIGPVAGSLVDSRDCIGQVAVIQIHGSKDTMVPAAEGMKSRDYWIGINSCSSEASETTQGADPYCVEYAGCDADFPVQYCLHDLEDPTHSYPGHAWPGFAGDAIWNFFKSLPPAEQSSVTGTGDVPEMVPGKISFKIKFPSDFVGTPEILAVALYPPDTVDPEISPTYYLATDIPLGDYKFGEVTEYNDIDIDLTGVEFGDYMLSVVIYVEGGSYPIPTTGKDYTGLLNITIDSDIIIVETPLELVFCSCC